MGSRLANRLLAAGYPLTVYDAYPLSAFRALLLYGAKRDEHDHEAGRECAAGRGMHALGEKAGPSTTACPRDRDGRRAHDAMVHLLSTVHEAFGFMPDHERSADTQ